MKAAVYDRYGPPDVVRVSDVANPVPGDSEVLIRVRAAALNPLDFVIQGKPYTLRLMTGLRRPGTTRLGVDVAGVVEAAGRNVTRFRPGDQVFGFCVRDPLARGIAAWACQGSLAEYACAPELAVAAIPGNVTFEQAAAVPVAAVTALQGLRDKGQVRPGQKVLVNGAAGGVGTCAVQIARSLGAEVTGVCSTRHAALVRSIGADHVIDYTREDFTSNRGAYDVFFDLVGNRSLSACRRVLKPQGIYIGAGTSGSRWFLSLAARPAGMLLLSRFASQKLVIYLARPDQEDLTAVAGLMAAGKLTPVIDRRYKLDEVRDALRYLQQRHAQGKVVIDLGA
jgi:NADPH:quinone reductase-like Zn-dependent oxidoreductase